ncbi:D-glycero-beta-D-manno-heptose-1,7-bisphosphate 7-phosphatase [Thalassocella blandensis]|nr:D-glycero-beta-D-manno-heptose-1,7-bisphosphate 7-phosphatase [Thalassocella blandensis]
MTPWVILDRDGVINVDSDDYIKSQAEWKPIPGSIEAIVKLCDAGFHIAVATNQSGIARGLFSEVTLEAIHKLMHQQVEERGGIIEGVFYCPHGPDDNCTCRKPNIGLLDEIEEQFSIALEGVPFVGDSLRDLQAAKTKGCDPILVRTGKGKKTYAGIHKDALWADLPVYDDLQSFVDSFLQQHKQH